jgi:hypothetical protein
MARMNSRHTKSTILGLLLAGAMASPALAQADKLDKVRFIEGLRKEGLGDLLKRYTQTEPSKDPVLLKQVLVNQLLLDYQEKMDESFKMRDSGNLIKAEEIRKEAVSFFTKAIDARRVMIKEFADHEERPLWQTDLVEMLLTEYLRAINNNAGEFYEFGVPSKEQKEIFEKYIPEAIEQISDADDRLFNLQGTLPREADHTSKRVNTLVWQRMMEQYFKTRTPYFAALAAYYAASLPESDPFWKNVGKNPLIRKQKNNYKEERDRLLREETIERLEKFFTNKDAEYAELRRVANTLIGRAMIARGNPKEGLVRIEQAMPADVPGQVPIPKSLNNLTAQLAKIKGLGADAKTVPAAVKLAKDLLGDTPHPIVASNLSMRVLVTDALHNLLLQQANTLSGDAKIKALDEAYKPYLEIIGRKDLDQGKQEMLRMFIYGRWESSIPENADLNTLPPIVVAAIGDMALLNGQALDRQATALQATDPKGAAALRAQASVKFKRCIEVGGKLVERKDLGAMAAGTAIYDTAVAFFLLNQGDPNNQLVAANLLLKMAQQYPEHPRSVDAMSYSISFLQELYRNPNHPPATDYLYHQAFKTQVSDSYKNIPNNDFQRLAYVDLVLSGGRNRGDAALGHRPLASSLVLQGVTADAPLYPTAQLELVIMLQSAFHRAVEKKPESGSPNVAPVAIQLDKKYPPYFTDSPAPIKESLFDPLPNRTADELGKEVIATADNIIANADNWAANAKNDVQKLAAVDAGAWARLVRADMAIEHENQFEKALEILADFEQRYQGNNALIKNMLAKRIISYFKASKIEEAVNVSRNMMRDYPDEAAAVVEQVLTDLNTQVQNIRNKAESTQSAIMRDDLLKSAVKLQVAAKDLAKILLDRALDPKFELTPLQQLAPRLVFARALLNNNEVEQAETIVKPLLELKDKEIERQGQLQYTGAMIYYRLALDSVKTDRSDKAKQAALAMLDKEVFKRLSKLIGNITQVPKPDLFWQSWLLTLQTAGAMYDMDNTKYAEYKKLIPQKIKALRGTDPNLGGPRFKEEFERLSSKYSV